LKSRESIQAAHHMTESARGASPGEHLTSLHIHKAIANDRESVAWLASRFTPLMLCQAYQRIAPALRRYCDPHDVVADVWMVVLSSLPRLVPSDGSMTSGLLRFASTVMIRRLRDLLKKHVIDKPTTFSLATEDASVDELPAGTRDVVNHVISEERRGAVWASLSELAPEDREILVLHGIEGRPHKDVAVRLGVTPENAAVRYHRALKRLRERMPASIFDDLEE
jgi:RNA polymerase sigma-70 factor, ECF subfamily